MSISDNSKPAFPMGATVPDGNGMLKWQQVDGMTLREYYAGKNVAAMVSTIRNDDGYVRVLNIAKALGYNSVSAWFAGDAVKQADALIAALQEK